MRYSLGPYVWDTDGWFPPAGSTAIVDLRPIPAQAATTLGSKPIGFFAHIDPIGDDYDELAAEDLRDATVTTAMLNAWQSIMGYRPAGARLVDLLWDQLTNGADPDGKSGPLPLVPEADGIPRLHLAAHSVVKIGPRINPGNGPSRWERSLRDLYRSDYQSKHGRNPREAHRMLGWLQIKYRLSDAHTKLLAPPGLQNSAVIERPGTIQSDDFSSGSLAGWTAISGTWSASTNTLRKTAGGGYELIVYSTALGAADMTVTGNVMTAALNAGPAARCNTSTANAYIVTHFSGSTNQVAKVVSGTRTFLASVPSHTFSSADTWSIAVSGSSITGCVAADCVGPTTDTAVATGSHGGAVQATASSSDAFDNWQADDGISDGSGKPYYAYAQQ